MKNYFFLVLLSILGSQNALAQTDEELFDKYVWKAEADLSPLKRATEQIPDRNYAEVYLNTGAEQTLTELINGHHQAKVLRIILMPSDTANLSAIFSLLQQFPHLEALTFYDDGERVIKRNYQLPEEILKLSNLKFISIKGARNLDINDTFKKIAKMPKLRGIDLLDYNSNLPAGAELPVQLTFVKLATPQLQTLNTTHAKWRMAVIETRDYKDPRNEKLLEKLAALNSLEVLEFKVCFVDDGNVFKKFNKLTRLKIQPALLSKDAAFVKSLTSLTQLKELAIYSITDTSQSFSDLDKFTHLESLDLRWISRFENHPAELMNIGKLTSLKSLTMESCHFSTCPDFFKTLTKLESVTLKWNKERWNENSSFSLPDGLYQLPELKRLSIWKTISEAPSLHTLKKLRFLDLSYNNLKKVPEGISNLNQLNTLFLAGNQLTAIQNLPWEKLKAIENLDLSRNKITQFPEGLQHLHQLKYLNLSANAITTFPPLGAGKYQMTMLAIDNNPIANLPANISQMDKLKFLSASNCSLTTLPDGIGELKQLRLLNLERNNLTALPQGLAENQNLRDLNLKDNKEMQEQNILDVVFGKPRKQFIRANLNNTGLKTLPANAAWKQLGIVLDLSNNQLKTLPEKMSQMKWFNIAIKNNPLPLDTGFMEKGIYSAADAKIIFEELGHRADELKVGNQELATSMSQAIWSLSRTGSFEKAVYYADRAKALNAQAYTENVNWYSIGIARFNTKDYKQAIADLQTQLRTTYRTWWRSMMAKQSEAALADAYLQIDEKRKAADIHAFFNSKRFSQESSLSAALSYQELGEDTLSKKYFDSAALYLKKEYLEYSNIRDIYIYNYAEVLLMADQADEVLKLFQSEDPKILNSNPAYRHYLETAALLIKYPRDHKKLMKDYTGKIAQYGKVTDWDYTNFNRWIKNSRRPETEKKQLYALEEMNR